MSKLSIINFFEHKSIKLTDSFIVYIKNKNDDVLVPEYSIVGFTLPKFEFEEDILYYGNTAQKFLIPKYDAIKELSLDFIETYNGKFAEILKINSFNGFGAGYQPNNEGSYSNAATIAELEIRIFTNDFCTVPISYVFTNLKLVKADMYSLSYTDESPCKINATFEFETYKMITNPAIDTNDCAYNINSNEEIEVGPETPPAESTKPSASSDNKSTDNGEQPAAEKTEQSSNQESKKPSDEPAPAEQAAAPAAEETAPAGEAAPAAAPEAPATAPVPAKETLPAKEHAGVDVDRLKKILGKNEGTTDFVYSNVIKDKQQKINKKFNASQQKKMKAGEHFTSNGVEYFWDEKRNSFAHYDLATVGKGLTFKYALADKNVTLIDENGNKVTKTGAEWNKEFEKDGLDKMPDGRGRDMGGTPTTVKWHIDPQHAEDLFDEALNSYIDSAKRTATKNGLKWDELTQEDKLTLVDNQYNGGAEKAALLASAMQQNGGTLTNYADALSFAERTTNTADTLKRFDLINGTNYAQQFAKQNKKK